MSLTQLLRRIGRDGTVPVVVASLLLSCSFLTQAGGSSGDSRLLSDAIGPDGQLTAEAVGRSEEDIWEALRAPLREQLGEDPESVFQQLDKVRQALLAQAQQDLNVTGQGSKPPGLAQIEALGFVTVALSQIPGAFADRGDGSSTSTEHVTEGAAKGDMKFAVSKSASRLAAEIEMTMTLSRANGAVVTETARGKMEIDLCPDAEGRAPVSLSLTMNSEVSAGDEALNMQFSLDGSTDALVNDNADLTGFPLDIISGFGAQGRSGSERKGTFVETHTRFTMQNMEPEGDLTMTGYESSVTRSSSGANESNTEAAQKFGQNMAVLFGTMVLRQAEEVWQNGYCVVIIVDGVEDTTVVSPGSSTPFTARVHHKFEGVELNGPIEGTLSGKESLAPQGKAEAPVHYTYVAPQESASSATAALETRSRRGVAKRNLEFRTGTPNYHPIAPQPLQWSGIVCSLEEPFSLSAIGTITGSWDFVPSNASSGSVTFRGTSGDCEDQYSGRYIIEQYAEGDPQADIIMDVKGQMICPDYTAPYDTQLRILLEPISDPSCQ